MRPILRLSAPWSTRSVSAITAVGVRSTSMPRIGRSSSSSAAPAARSWSLEIAGSASPAALDVPDRREQVARGDALVEQPVRARDDRGHGHRPVGEGGVEDHPGRQRLRLDVAADREAVDVGQAVVEHDDVGPAAVQHRRHLAGVGGRSHRDESWLGADRGVQAEPDGLVVVDDRDADHDPTGWSRRRPSTMGGAPQPRSRLDESAADRPAGELRRGRACRAWRGCSRDGARRSSG